jgi:hypothetical protein
MMGLTMKIFGALIALLGGLLQLLAGTGMYALSQTEEAADAGAAEVLSGFGAAATGVAVFILIAAGFAFMSSGRFAGVLLMALSVVGFFTGGGLLMALPFFGGIFVMAGGGSRVTMGSNYT